MAYYEKSVNQPFWIFHGAEDNVVGVKHSVEMYDRIVDLGGQASYTEYFATGHNSWVKAFAEPNLLNWIFRKQK